MNKKLNKILSQIDIDDKKELKCWCKAHVSDEFLQQRIINCVDGGNSVVISDNAGNCEYNESRNWCYGACQISIRCGDNEPETFGGACQNKIKKETFS